MNTDPALFEPRTRSTVRDREALQPLDAARGAALEEAHPFPLLDQFPDLRLGIFTKRDDCRSDGQTAAELGFRRVAHIEQVHGTTTHVVRTPIHRTLQGDGLITDQPNLALSIRWADCQNFVVYAPSRQRLPRATSRGSKKTGVIGVLHVGWRGLAQGAITALFHTLKRTFDIAPQDTFVAAGPSLCRRCAVFSDPFQELPPHLHRFIEGSNVDLCAAADAELLSLGVPASHLERHPDCTACQSDRYWTSRGGDREEVQSGRARNYLIAGMTS